ncbi:MAG: hypothetical protein ACHQ9S_22115 [Candidatus Binatia bacterium]
MQPNKGRLGEAERATAPALSRTVDARAPLQGAVELIWSGPPQDVTVDEILTAVNNALNGCVQNP